MKTTLAFLVIAAFACNTQVYAWNGLDGPIGSAKLAVDTLIFTAMGRLQTIVDDINIKFNKYIADARHSVDLSKVNSYRRLHEILQNVDGKIKELQIRSKEHHDIDFSSCREIAYRIQKNVVEFANATNICYSDKISQIIEDVVPYQNKVNEVSGLLSGYLRAAADCVKDPTELSGAKVSCLTQTYVIAAANIARNVPGLVGESVKFTGKAFWAPYPTAYCLAKQGFRMTYHQSQSLYKSLETCISNRMNGFGKRLGFNN